jgi:hypothetical protein
MTRAVVFGAVAFTLSWAAHLGAGGSSPGAGALVLLGVLTALGATLVTRWRLGPVGLVAVLGSTQLALHESLMWLAPSQSGACTAVVMAGGHHGGEYVMSCGSAAPTMAMPLTGGSSALMVAAHVAATVVLALVLSVGERALWFLATLMRPVLLWWPEVLVLGALARVRAQGRVAGPGPLQFVRGGVGRRGPPRRGVLVTV